MIDPGDDVIVPAPSYPAHVYAVALTSGNPVPSIRPNQISFCQKYQHAVEARLGRRKYWLLISRITQRQL